MRKGRPNCCGKRRYRLCNFILDLFFFEQAADTADIIRKGVGGRPKKDPKTGELLHNPIVSTDVTQEVSTTNIIIQLINFFFQFIAFSANQR